MIKVSSEIIEDGHDLCGKSIYSISEEHYNYDICNWTGFTRYHFDEVLIKTKSGKIAVLLSKDLDDNSFIASYNCLHESKKIKVTTHNYNGYLGTFMSANFASIIPNFLIGEIDIDEIQNLEKIFTIKPNIKGRFLEITDRPGWGCDLIENRIKKVFSAKN